MDPSPSDSLSPAPRQSAESGILSRRAGGAGRPRLWAVLPLLLAVLLVGPGFRWPRPDGGFAPHQWLRHRAQAYLEFATSVQSNSILNAIAHMERDRVDPRYRAPVGALDVDAWSGIFEKLDALQDTRDFDGLYLLNALLGYEGHPYLTPALWERVREALLSFKYWYTDPTPPRPDPDDPLRDWDNSFYWTENHQILYHTLEYLAGQRFPDECFTIVGFEPTPDCSSPAEMTGAEHMARARPKILRWLDERWEIGFVEWHSNIYYQKDATPLLTLVEYAQDEEVRTRAAMILDILLLDLAVHTHRGVFGVTHGRSEMKDAHRGPANDTWGIVLLLFGQQDEVGYASTGDAGATLFARAKRYRMPRLVLEAARSKETFVDRERMSVFVDETTEPSDDPEHPPGHSFEDTEANFTFWWGLEAWTIWQVVPLTILNAERYNLWPTELLRPFLTLRDLLGDPPSIEVGKTLASILWPQAAMGLLKEVNTYTYRTPDYVLSTAQDYRKGANSTQVHTWQATLDVDTLVFTNHPGTRVQPPSAWLGRSDGQPGYWTGSASLPRSAQHENVGIQVYSPLYPQSSLGGLFRYEPVTHAYFPQDHFDAVVQEDGWTFGQRGDAYVALYSWRPTVWQEYDAAELALLPPSDRGPITSSFDLVAPGGPDNVWIVECGRAAEWGTFATFRSAVLAAEVAITPRDGPIAGVERFDVFYDSPSQGPMSFGWDAPLTVRGEEVPLRDYPRLENPWVRAERGDRVILLRGEHSAARLDWDAGSRDVFRLRGPRTLAGAR